MKTLDWLADNLNISWRAVIVLLYSHDVVDRYLIVSIYIDGGLYTWKRWIDLLTT